jgi:hypothetical protein
MAWAARIAGVALIAIALVAVGGALYRGRLHRTTDTRIPATLVPVLDEKLADWIQAYRARTPAFAIQAFRKAREGRVQFDYVERYDPSGRWEQVRRPIHVYSPDRAKFIDPYASLQLLEDEGRLAAAFDVEPAVVVVDLSERGSMRLRFCEAPCGYHGAVWLSDAAFVVIGHREDPSDLNCPQSPCTYVPAIWIYQLDRGIATEYVGPGAVDYTGEDYVWKRLLRKLPRLDW